MRSRITVVRPVMAPGRCSLDIKRTGSKQDSSFLPYGHVAVQAASGSPNDCSHFIVSVIRDRQICGAHASEEGMSAWNITSISLLEVSR